MAMGTATPMGEATGPTGTGPTATVVAIRTADLILVTTKVMARQDIEAYRANVRRFRLACPLMATEIPDTTTAIRIGQDTEVGSTRILDSL